MDLKIKDVAELLGVSETTIRRWLADGIIPAYRLNHQFRFSREEIQNWVMSCRMNRPAEEAPPQKISLNDEKTESIIGHRMGTQAYSLFRALYKGSVLDEISSHTKEEVIEESVQIIAKNLSLDAEVLTELLLDRERLMPTGLNHGVAVPHSREIFRNDFPGLFDHLFLGMGRDLIQNASLVERTKKTVCLRAHAMADDRFCFFIVQRNLLRRRFFSGAIHAAAHHPILNLFAAETKLMVQTIGRNDPVCKPAPDRSF